MKDYKLLQANDDTEKHYSNYDPAPSFLVFRCDCCQEKKRLLKVPFGVACIDCLNWLKDRNKE